jgi:protein-L-isoaspartate(D-aspartate) O-methyltransferase
MTLDAVRRAYAEEVRAVAHLESSAIVEAFARVPREEFLGPGPWLVARPLEPGDPYRTTADADPRHVYHDVVIALDPVRQLNNGQPSSLARWIEAAALAPGDAVLHIGCGVGYYTAIMAELVGPTGRVAACEVDPGFAARARELLAPWPHVAVEASDAGSPSGRFDAIFVNAGVTYVPTAWTAALRPGGRLIVPVTVHLPNLPGGSSFGVGVMLRVERGDGRWPARVVSQVGIFDCVNARDPAHEAELLTLARSGGTAQIRAVVVDPHDRGDSCLAHLPGFCLQR